MFIKKSNYDIIDSYEKGAFSVDKWIANSIQKLNRLGYYTYSSCSSHITNGCQSQGYIVFKYAIDFDSVPNGWNQDQMIMDDKIRTIIEMDFDAIRKYGTIELMNRMNKWVGSL